MATAYKYVERKAEDNINWAEVGSNVNNMLKEELRVREEKKSAIDEASREYQRVLNNVPQGENEDLNGFALDFSNPTKANANARDSFKEWSIKSKAVHDDEAKPNRWY